MGIDANVCGGMGFALSLEELDKLAAYLEFDLEEEGYYELSYAFNERFTTGEGEGFVLHYNVDMMGERQAYVFDEKSYFDLGDVKRSGESQINSFHADPAEHFRPFLEEVGLEEQDIVLAALVAYN